MEKQTKSDNEVETLTGRWDTVKKVADDRVKKVRQYPNMRILFIFFYNFDYGFLLNRNVLITLLSICIQ